MVLILIFLFTVLCMWGCLVFSYQSASEENGKYLLGITLPPQYRREPQVLEVLEKYRHRLRRLHIIGLLSGLVTILLSDYCSLLIIYLISWFGLLCHFYQQNVRDSAAALYEVKRRNGWLTGDPHIVRIDTALSSIGNRGAVSLWWLLPAWLIGGSSCALSWKKVLEGGGSLPSSLTAATISFAVMEGLLLLICVGIRRARPQVYCSNTLANQKMNNVVKREWSCLMVLYAYGIAVFTIFMTWPGRHDVDGFTHIRDLSVSSLISAVMVLLFGSLGGILLIYLTYDKIRRVKVRILQNLAEEGTQLYGDDDEYWLNGYPEGIRPHGLTEKRIGIGMTTNPSLKPDMGEKAVWIITAVFILGIALFLLPFDFARISMNVEEDRCIIRGASMSCTFDLDEVEDIALVPERPSMSKRNGFDSNRFYLGDFKVEGYGNCKVYVCLKQELVIRVRTQDGIIWFNSESREETEKFYEELCGQLAGE